jgi:hypothetical protein
MVRKEILMYQQLPDDERYEYQADASPKLVSDEVVHCLFTRLCT